MASPAALNPRHQRFVDEYLLDLNAADAYRRAGYKAAGQLR
jgi:phage terminase small subunit